MLKDTLIELYERDLNNVRQELALYAHESDIWKIKPGIANCTGNLVLHLLGNVNHFIGATLGNTGYIRKRDDEFALKNIPRDSLYAEIEKAKAMIKNTFLPMKEGDFEKEFPLEVGNRKASTSHFMIFFLAHFNYHLGQINYHRRLTT